MRQRSILRYESVLLSTLFLMHQYIFEFQESESFGEGVFLIQAVRIQEILERLPRSITDMISILLTNETSDSEIKVKEMDKGSIGLKSKSVHFGVVGISLDILRFYRHQNIYRCHAGVLHVLDSMQPIISIPFFILTIE
jgi:hypothetical protein